MNTKTWWYAVNNEQKGPVSFSELKLLIEQSILNNETLVWKQGLPNWIKYAEMEQEPPLIQEPAFQTDSNNTQTHSSVEAVDYNLLSVDQYYRTEFEKIISSNETYKGRWNWWAFLFSWIWCFSKGLWAWALIILLPVLALYSFDASVLSFIYAIIFWFFLGSRGTWFYYNLKIKGKQMP